MKSYSKIDNLFKRDPKTHRLIEGEWKSDVFACLAGAAWSWTEKVDGTNIRAIWDGRALDVRGRTDRAQLHPDLIRRIQELLPQDRLATVFGAQHVTLYGEGYGAGIQKGGRYSDRKEFICFDVLFGSDGEGRWAPRDVVGFLGDALGIDYTPVIGSGSLYEAVDFARDGFASGIAVDQSLEAEGLVVRPIAALFDGRGSRIIAKIKSRDYAAAVLS